MKKPILILTMLIAALGFNSVLNAGTFNRTDHAYSSSLFKTYSASVPSTCTLKVEVFGDSWGSGGIDLAATIAGTGGSVSRSLFLNSYQTSGYNSQTKTNQGSGTYSISHVMYFGPGSAGSCTVQSRITW